MIDVQVGSYRIIQWLAKGGMGEVYLARHEIMDRSVVVKVLHPDLSQNKDQVTRFFNEARAAASIQHPAIVDIFDVGYADGRAYIVMEYLLGETLAARLERERFELEHALAVIRQLVGALRAAHERGIVHRDLKPENIYMVPDPDVPGGERVKVIDFGVAKLAQEHTPSMTARGSIFGTPAYMAPEQCTDSAAVDHRADLYALGCILYELLCGTPPFGRGGLELLAAHLRDEPPPLRSHDPSIPDDIEEITLRLLAKKPDERFASCDALIDGIEQTEAFVTWSTERLSRPSLPPFGYSTIPPFARPARPSQDLAYAATMACLPPSEPPPGELAGNAPDAAITAADHEPGSARPPTDTTFFSAGQVRSGSPASPPRGPSRRWAVVAAAVLVLGGVLLGLFLQGRSTDAPVTTPARTPVVMIESPPDAAPAATPETELLDEARRALAEQRWEDAVHSARKVIEALSDQPEAEPRKQAEAVHEQARSEQRNQWLYDSFLDALAKSDIRGVVHGYEQIPRNSVYRDKALARYRRARDEWLTPRLKQASTHALMQQCDRIDPIELEVGFLFPESVAQLRDIAAKCRSGIPAVQTDVSASAAIPLMAAEAAAEPTAGQSARSAPDSQLQRMNAINLFLQQAKQPINECATHYGVTGKVFLHFEISPEGKTEGITTSTGPDEFQHCVQRVLGWRQFPPLSETTEVSRTLRFEP